MKTLGEMTFEEALPIYEAFHNKRPLEKVTAEIDVDDSDLVITLCDEGPTTLDRDGVYRLKSAKKGVGVGVGADQWLEQLLHNVRRAREATVLKALGGALLPENNSLEKLKELTMADALPIYEAFHEGREVEELHARFTMNGGPVQEAWLPTTSLRPDGVYRIKVVTRTEMLDRLEALSDPIGKMAADEIRQLEKERDANHLQALQNGGAALADDGWIDWHGGECPVGPSQEVGVVFRGDGDAPPSRVRRARAMCWGHNGSGSDIVRYRVVTPTP